ncbi:type II toxin-antitoxin system Phd/YefM family antitoxin [Derxia gummosa]|uniref:Antitoxin n=1 Tax=Derxia gummosa DSM 723 TaxID=1121388 RepID=A0A8B6X351_9BURK|nr:type II toxin-antitoxin system prevent-host-death family antitoxin [Derxia gummosa]
MQIGIRDARNRLSQLIKAAQAGAEVVIAKRDRPVARLVAVEVPEIGRGRQLLDWLEAHPLPAHLRDQHERIEGGIQAERAAWD